MMKILQSILITVTMCMFSVGAYAQTNVTNDQQTKNFVVKQINKELASVDKRHKISKIQKIFSEYDSSERIYLYEVDFKWKDEKGKIHECSANVTKGAKAQDNQANIPYVCYRNAGLG